MNYEISKIKQTVAEIEEKLESFNSHLDWLESDTQNLAEATRKQAAYQTPQIELPTQESRLNPKEIQQRYAEQGETYINNLIEELSSQTALANPQYPTTVQQQKMLDLFRQNCSTNYIVDEFLK